MVVVDFFGEEKIVNSLHFGICDEPDETVKTPAYIDCDEENESLWTANVTNKSEKDIAFIAVDNKIEILREDGSTENRCDAILHNNDNIIFVELKNQRNNWIKHAVEKQLLTTINIFKQNNNIEDFRHRLAYVCNKRHPHFSVSHKQYMQKFRSENNVRLIIGSNIIIKKLF